MAATMRARLIKPGIVNNEELCELGPYAYILFTGLWMMADREGRFEWRPKRIKAVLMPLWPEVTWQDVEKLLENLCKTGFIHRYEMAGKAFGVIVSWRKHQSIHPKEAKSELPPPPKQPRVNGPESTSSKDRGIPCNSGELPGISGELRVNLPTSTSSSKTPYGVLGASRTNGAKNSGDITPIEYPFFSLG